MSTAIQFIDVSPQLIDAIGALPANRSVIHCGEEFEVAIFDIYAVCPHCGEEIKVRSFAVTAEIEDVFDAVFEWMADPSARDVAMQRVRDIEDEH